MIADKVERICTDYRILRAKNSRKRVRYDNAQLNLDQKVEDRYLRHRCVELGVSYDFISKVLSI